MSRDLRKQHPLLDQLELIRDAFRAAPTTELTFEQSSHRQSVNYEVWYGHLVTKNKLVIRPDNSLLFSQAECSSLLRTSQEPQP